MVDYPDQHQFNVGALNEIADRLEGGAQSLEGFNAGRRFYATTGEQAIAANEALTLRIANPSGSGRNITILYRAFINNRQGNDDALRRAISVDQAPLGGDAFTPIPMNGAASDTSVAVIEVAVGTPALTVGPFLEPLPINFVAERIEGEANRYIVAPGQAAAYLVYADSLSAKAGITYIWEESDA